MKNLTLFSALLLLCVASANAQGAPSDDAMKNCPMHQQHSASDSRHAAVEERGDHAMGFPHDKTTRHFRLVANGGAIEVTANDLNDRPSADAVRSHLSKIAVLFGAGDFSTPMLVHNGIPPGVTTMQLLKASIHYKYEEISAGGRVLIESSDPVAVAAIHDFLRFQITDHQTGDPLGAVTVH